MPRDVVEQIHQGGQGTDRGFAVFAPAPGDEGVIQTFDLETKATSEKDFTVLE
jgi:hypothetical protein